MDNNIFEQMDFGPLQQYLDNDDVTDISYSNGGQVWLKTLSHGIFRIENPAINNNFMEKLAFQCSNVVGHSFNAAHPFLDSEDAELRMNFIHESIARNGIACVIRKTPAKIRLEKDKIIKDKYITEDIHDFLIHCVHGHCNIIVCGETGSGKTEFVKYLASHTRENEKLITIEDTLELHLDRIYPHRDIVAMKTNNVASYTDVLVSCMRQNPKWILLSEVRSAEAVTATRNSISSGHYILSTIHADKAISIPNRMYSLMENSQDIDQFLKSIYRYIQIGVYIRGYQDKKTQRFVREIAEVCEFYVTEKNDAEYNVIYRKTPDGKVVKKKPTRYLLDYLEAQGVILPDDLIVEEETDTGEALFETDTVDKNVGMKIEDFTNGANTPNVQATPQAQPAVQQVVSQPVQQPRVPVQPQASVARPATFAAPTQQQVQQVVNTVNPGVAPQQVATPNVHVTPMTNQVNTTN
jgi:pilus assembly protein CpaF